MLPRFRQLLGSSLAVDLGSTTTRIGVPGEGLLLTEPSLIAVDALTGRILPGGCAVGRLAKLMSGRTPQSIRVESPLREGVISDFALCQALVSSFVRKVQPFGRLLPLRILAAVPGSATPVERRALGHVLRRAGAGRVVYVPRSKAAAIGAGLPIFEPLGSLVCDLGGGTTEVAMLSLGDVVAHTSLRLGAAHLDAAFLRWMRRNHGLSLGPATAEELRLEIGAAIPSPTPRCAEACGVDAYSGLPRTVVITENDLCDAFREPLSLIAEGVRRTLDQSPPDLTADLLQQGMVLVGGGSLLPGIDRFLAEETGLPVRHSPEPESAVIRGVLLCLEQFARWSPVLQGAEVA